MTVSCTNINASNRENILSSQPNVLNKNTTSSTNPRTELSGQIEQISQAAQGRVGVTATVLETGESVTLNGNQRFPMQSVYKFPIAMSVLAKVDQGELKLDQKIRVEISDIVQGSRILDEKSPGVELRLDELLKYMVSESDNTACDVLLRLVGEPKIVTNYVRRLGVNDIIVANTEKELAQDVAVQYRNDATPDATVVLLRSFHEGKGLSKSSQALLQRWMTETSTGLKRLKGRLPDGTVVAHKTGTSATVNGVTAATNDVGLVTLPNGRHLAIAVFVSDSTADTAIREEVIAKVVRAVWDEWSK
ncbi:class A beta-lactamase [Nostoc sp. MG11]|uniref:class A beta-lactamase n=1 Tax=Nostoc sp. MG11 TaxID=2721166 RepID=UPI001D035B9F|nr:class A beta-lactamase [Nostoc sp. MG11]